MSNIQSYRDLIAWQKSIALVTDVYKLTSKFPSNEKYGLISQINRAAVSVSANIAEGWGRETPKSFLQFLRTSRGSLMEVQTLLEIARNVELISAEERAIIIAKSDEVSKIIQGLIKNIQKNIKPVSK